MYECMHINIMMVESRPKLCCQVHAGTFSKGILSQDFSLRIKFPTRLKVEACQLRVHGTLLVRTSLLCHGPNLKVPTKTPIRMHNRHMRSMAILIYSI